MSEVLTAQGIHLSYVSSQAVKGANIALRRGEIVAVTGPSGSGKSSLLYCLAGVLPVSQGEVRFEKRVLGDMNDEELSSLRRDRFGFVFQYGELLPELTVEENAALPLRLAGQRKDGSTFPARVSLSPVATATGHFILAVIRDITADQPRADLADLARAAAEADDARRGRELFSRVVDSLFRVGLSLQAAIELPQEVAVQKIADALRTLDDTIGEIHDHVFAAPGQDDRPDPQPPGQAR